MENLLFLFNDTDPSIPTKILLSRLTPLRLQKALRYKSDADRRICAWSEILLFYALHEVNAEESEVVWDGKPHLTDGKYHFSLSHTGDQIALLLAKSPCGVDIEIPHTIREKKALCARLFTEKERAALLTDEDFFYAWTAKEAYVKYTGEGFSRPFSSFFLDFTVNAVYDSKTEEKLASFPPFTAFDGTVGCACSNTSLHLNICLVTPEKLI